MMFWKKKPSEKKSVLTFTGQLDATICFNHKVTVDKVGEDYVRLKTQLKLTKTALFWSKFFPVRDYRMFILNGFGFVLFREIYRSNIQVIDLIRFLQDTQKLSFFEARVLMLQYVGSLMQRGIVVVEVGGQKPADDEPDADPAYAERHA